MTSSDLWDAGTAARYDETRADMFTPEVLDRRSTSWPRLAGDGAPSSWPSAPAGWAYRSGRAASR